MYQREVTLREAIDFALRRYYCNFFGRASASEFWWFVFFFVMSVSLTMFISGVLGRTVALVLGALLALQLLLPLVSLTVRRLHDVGHSGWWLLLVFTGVGIILLLVWLAMPSIKKTNRYGDIPNLID